MNRELEFWAGPSSWETTSTVSVVSWTAKAPISPTSSATSVLATSSETRSRLTDQLRIWFLYQARPRWRVGRTG